MKAETVNQEVLPQQTRGVDWSAPRTVIARMGDKVLFSRRGVTKSGCDVRYIPTERVLIVNDEFKTRVHLDNYGEPAERMSKKYLLSRAEKIDKFFGPGTASLIAENYRAGLTVVLS